MIDMDKCIGCGACFEACPYTPSRLIVGPDERYHKKEKARKCDLCTDSPHWKEKGGVDGKQACVSICPVGALKLVKSVPVQKGDAGYKVNLRGKTWESMGYPID